MRSGGFVVDAGDALGKFSNVATTESYVSAEYSSVDSTVVLYTLHFVDIEIPCCDHTRFLNPHKAPEAAFIRLYGC